MSAAPVLLIVDDSRVSRTIIRNTVTQLRPAWTLVEAVSGDEALAKVDESKPNFISMDMNMPGISGLDAARQILAAHPGIRIAMCTANIQDSVQAEASAAGLFFVGKPITEAGIAKAIAFYEGSV